MPQRVFSRQPLRDVDVDAESAAHYTIPQSMGGRARWLYEHVTGTSAVSGEPAESPRGPSGFVSHDHSGPPFGEAIQHPIAWSGGGHATTWDGVRPMATLPADGLRTLSLPWVVRVRPFARYPDAALGTEPYARAYPRLRVALSAATAITLGIRVSRVLPGGGIDRGVRETVALSASTATQTVACSTSHARLSPGICRLLIELDVSAATPTVRVLSMVLPQTARRSH